MSASNYASTDFWGAAISSVALHVIIIVMLAFNFDLSGKENYVNHAKIIDAIVVDSNVLDALDKKKQQEAEKKQQQLLAEQKRQREAERLKEQRLQQQRLAEQRKLEQEKRLAEEKQLREQARQAEEKRQLEQAQLEEWRKLQAEEQVAAEQARARELADNMALYEQSIRQRLDRNWIRPISTQDWYRCEVSVDQIPGGEVVNVEILECDGDAVFQRSVRNAVYKSSPLPDPPDPRLFERKLKIKFKVPTE